MQRATAVLSSLILVSCARGVDTAAPDAAASSEDANVPEVPRPPDGTVLDAFVVGGNANETLTASAVSPTGDIALAGWFENHTDLGMGSVIATSGNQGNKVDGFLAVRRSDGTPRFARIFGSCGIDVVTGIASDETGAIYAAVSAFESNAACSLAMDGVTLTDLTWTNWQVTALVKLDANGGLVWHRMVPGTIEQMATRSGKLVVTTVSADAVDLGNSVTIPASTAALTTGIAVLSTIDGTAMWGRSLGPTSSVEQVDVRPSLVDPVASTIALSVTLGTTWDLGGTAGTITPQGPTDAVFIELALDSGTALRAHRVGGSGADATHAVNARSGSFVAGGTYVGSITSGGVMLPSGMTGTDGFVLREDAGITTLWSLGLDVPTPVWAVAPVGDDVVVLAQGTGEVMATVITRRGHDGTPRWTHALTPADTGARIMLLHAHITNHQLVLVGQVGQQPGTLTLPGGIVRPVAGSWDLAVVVVAL